MAELKRNAIIMAAGTSSRFVPLSAEFPKGLLNVKGEILIERQIRQLKEAGVNDITIVVGYKSEAFTYLKEKYSVNIIKNEDFDKYNNTSSLFRVLDRLGNTFICSSDNYFPENVFIHSPAESYYSALYNEGDTNEYCINVDKDDNITAVEVGGRNSWYMVGHVYFANDFSRKFAALLKQEYQKEETRHGYWEDVYIRFIDRLPKMKIHRYKESDIKEFDSLDELRQFDESYKSNTRSSIVRDIAERLKCDQSELTDFFNEKYSNDYMQFTFHKDNDIYRYLGSDKSITKL